MKDLNEQYNQSYNASNNNGDRYKPCNHCKCRKFSGPNNIILIIFNTIVILFSISIFILSFLMKNDDKAASAISKELIDNFNNGYFLDFWSCNANENRISFGTWPGTVKGCGKIENDMPIARIMNEKKDKCEKGEKFLDSIPSQEIFSYKGITICGKTKERYYDLLFSDSIVGENEDCPEGMKNCGIIDTVKNKLCLKNNSECPISYIQIKDINSSAPVGITNLKEIKSEKIKFFFQITLIPILLKRHI